MLKMIVVVVVAVPLNINIYTYTLKLSFVPAEAYFYQVYQSSWGHHVLFCHVKHKNIK